MIPTDPQGEGWPREFNTNRLIRQCPDCKHPVSYHALCIRKGKSQYECQCGCILKRG